MSVLNKTPYLNAVLSQLTNAELVELKDLIDGNGSFIYRSLEDANNLLNADDKLKAINLQLSKKLPMVAGYFLGNCFIQFFFNRPEIQLYSIDLDNMKYKVIDEPCTATDLRQIVEDKLIDKGVGDYVNEEELQNAVKNCARTWTTNYDANEITDIDFDKVEAGDLIYSKSEETIYLVDCKYPEFICLKRTSSNTAYRTIYQDYYNYEKTDNEWTFKEEITNAIEAGARLYKHTITDTLDFKLDADVVVSTSSTPLTDMDSFSELMNNSVLFGGQNYVVLLIHDGVNEIKATFISENGTTTETGISLTYIHDSVTPLDQGDE